MSIFMSIWVGGAYIALKPIVIGTGGLLAACAPCAFSIYIPNNLDIFGPLYQSIGYASSHIDYASLASYGGSCFIGLSKCLINCIYWEHVGFQVSGWAWNPLCNRFTSKNNVMGDTFSNTSSITDTAQNTVSQATETVRYNNQVNSLIEKAIDELTWIRSSIF